MRNLTSNAASAYSLAASIAVQNCYPDMHLNVIISYLLYECLSDFLQEISDLKCAYFMKMGFCSRTKLFLKLIFCVPIFL